jgi:hypothetical protein
MVEGKNQEYRETKKRIIEIVSESESRRSASYFIYVLQAKTN